jgi:branched-chain amino acid transport system ATP-binding protein
MNEAILQVTNLAARYGRAQALFGIDLHVNAGEVVALMGRNGSGKSTMLKAILGLIAAEASALIFDGKDIRGWETYQIARSGLGYVPEDRRIFTDLTVAENLEVGRRAAKNKVNPWTIEKLFSVFPNLADMKNRAAGRMSGGEQQMLAIARTLMGNPRAILLDEPSEGLAPIIIDKMADAVLRMKSEGIAVLLSEQNLDFAAASGDRFYLIERGHFRFEGTLRDLIAADDIRREYLEI